MADAMRMIASGGTIPRHSSSDTLRARESLGRDSIESPSPHRQRESQAGSSSGTGSSPDKFINLINSLQREYWNVFKEKEALGRESFELRRRLRRTSPLSSVSGRHNSLNVDGIPSGGTAADVFPQVSSVAGDVGVPGERQALELDHYTSEQPSLVRDCSDELRDQDISFTRPDQELVSLDGQPSVTSLAEMTPGMSPVPSAELLQRMQVGPYAASPIPSHITEGGLGDEDSENRSAGFGARRSAQVEALFPAWWSPTRTAALRGCLPNDDIAALESRQHGTASTCILSPVSGFRLCWDLVAAMLLLYESWATPFALIFLVPDIDLPFMQVADYVILVFFSMDICLNFNTGVLIRGKIALDRKVVATSYLKHWFWLDFIATFPFDMLLPEGNDYSSIVRFLKTIKLLKTLRYLRLLRTTKELQRSETHFETVTVLKPLWYGLTTVLSLTVFVHIQCCIYAAIHNTTPSDNLAAGFQQYFDDFSDMYTTILGSNTIGAQTVAERCFEMVLVVYRLFIVVLLTTWAIFNSLLAWGDSTSMRFKTENTLTYLRRHRISVKSQIQVLYGLYEAGDAKKIKNDFKYLMDSELPAELQRSIMHELWTGRLQTLGIITEVNKWSSNSFIGSLALLCSEDVFATSSYLFREGDASIAAYHILNGEVGVTSSHLQKALPDFRDGMWLGENSLVNPSFLRGCTAITKSLCSVMKVPSEAFRNLLQDRDLEHRFEAWCRQELWRGLCGRCGLVGDHFSDECTSYPGPRGSSRLACLSKSTVAFQRGGHPRKSTKEMQEFLKHYGMDFLQPHLEELGVNDLDLLEEMDLSVFINSLKQRSPPIELSDNDVRALARQHIAKFRRDIEKGMQRLLDQPDKGKHFIFLSHYKLEAGTEAALMCSELDQLIKNDRQHVGSLFEAPVFLDSESLKDLRELREEVKRSHNMALLLTKGVLTRPWCIAELVTAAEEGIPVVLVVVKKPGNEFKFPDETFYNRLSRGRILDSKALDLLRGLGITTGTIEKCLREIFQSISVEYAPHQPEDLRRVQLKKILDRCTYKAPRKTKTLRTGERVVTTTRTSTSALTL